MFPIRNFFRMMIGIGR